MALVWSPDMVELPRVTRPNLYDFTVSVTDDEPFQLPTLAFNVVSHTFPPEAVITEDEFSVRVQGEVNYMFLPIEGIKYVVWTTPGLVHHPDDVPDDGDVYEWRTNPKMTETFTITLQASTSMESDTRVYTLTAYNNWNADRLALLRLLGL